MTWALANCEDPKVHWSPFTIPIPHRRIREAMSVGNFAQLVFVSGEVTQRLWVSILERLGARYRGQLVNKPDDRIEGLRFGEIVEFGPEHVAGWEP